MSYTVSDLKKLLEEYDDNDFVFITLEGSRSHYFIDKTEETINGKLVLACEDAPEFEDIEGMASACYEENKSLLSQLQITALSCFDAVAEELKAVERETRRL